MADCYAKFPERNITYRYRPKELPPALQPFPNLLKDYSYHTMTIETINAIRNSIFLEEQYNNKTKQTTQKTGQLVIGGGKPLSLNRMMR